MGPRIIGNLDQSPYSTGFRVLIPGVYSAGFRVIELGGSRV